MKGLEAVWHVQGDKNNTVDVLIVSEPMMPISYHHDIESEALEAHLDTETYVVVLPIGAGLYSPETAPLDHLHIQVGGRVDGTRQDMGLVE